MGTKTNIEWTDHTGNLWEGCTKISRACIPCYAWARDNRLHHGIHWGPHAPRKRVVTFRSQVLSWERKAKLAGVRAKVFCASLCDIADDHPTIQQSWRDELIELVLSTPNLDWQFLTKRPEDLMKFYPPEVLRRVWLGVTVEDQEQNDLRIPILRQISAVLHFLSVEPLLEHIDLDLEGIDWVIVGGCSGSEWKEHPMDIAWLESVVAQCRARGVPVFVKQDNAYRDGQQGRIPDEVWRIKDFPV